MVRHVGAQDAHDEPEVGREPVVEAVHRVAQEAARLDAVPGFTFNAEQRSEPLRMLGRLLGKIGRRQRRLGGVQLGPAEVALRLPSFLGQEQAGAMRGYAHVRYKEYPLTLEGWYPRVTSICRVPASKGLETFLKSIWTAAKCLSR